MVVVVVVVVVVEAIVGMVKLCLRALQQ